MSELDIFKPLLRKKTIDLGGGASVTIQEFPVTAHEDITAQLRDKDLEKNNIWYAKLAMRYLKGASYQPTDADAERFISVQSSATIQILVNEGIQFSGSPNVSEAGKKS